MKASFVDLRKKSKQIMQALARNERVTVYYRGKPAAIMQSVDQTRDGQTISAGSHPAFGMWADREDLQDVTRHMRELRKGRHHAL